MIPVDVEHQDQEDVFIPDADPYHIHRAHSLAFYLFGPNEESSAVASCRKPVEQHPISPSSQPVGKKAGWAVAKTSQVSLVFLLQLLFSRVNSKPPLWKGRSPYDAGGGAWEICSWGCRPIWKWIRMDVVRNQISFYTLLSFPDSKRTNSRTSQELSRIITLPMTPLCVIGEQTRGGIHFTASRLNVKESGDASSPVFQTNDYISIS